ncbi:Rpn family recombination-promoting nuclease/putative transposase [Frisingicoccus sp.]|uniref:Rpn family recombination-promoting nuclease/putative transposase n=1 Tax=Frisingicoccus sp. TaxID=1918627 RepID=UPI003AB89489
MYLKTWENLDITDDFLFGKVMRNPEICKQMIEAILDIKIERIEYPEEQKVIDMTADSKSVRLDVYVKDTKDVIYNIEMQPVKRDNLPKRSRYYQGMIDLNLIEKGDSYKNLNQSYVIFICCFDLFGRNRCKYTFENRCIEEPDIPLEDGTLKIFLNSKGDLSGLNATLRAFLSYINNGTLSENTFITLLDNEIKKARENLEWRREYMTLFMRDQENQELGRAEGRLLNNIALVRKKLAKNLSVEAIADILEENIGTIEQIVNLVHTFPEFSDEEILKEMQK